MSSVVSILGVEACSAWEEKRLASHQETETANKHPSSAQKWYGAASCTRRKKRCLCSSGMWLPQTKLDNFVIKNIGDGLQQQSLQNQTVYDT